MCAVTKLSAVYCSCFLIHIHDPQRYGNIRSVEHITGQNNDSFNTVTLQYLPAKRTLGITDIQRTIGKQKACNTVIDIELRQHMQYPRIVGISHRRHNRITRSHKARIVRQSIFCSPAFEVKGRIRHYVVNGHILMKIVCKRRSIGITEVMGNTTDSKVHFTKPPSVGVTFLSDDRYL